MAAVSIPNELNQPSSWRTWCAVGSEWLVILVLFWVIVHAAGWGAWRWPIWVVSFVLLGRQNNQLIGLMHEATHGCLFRSKGWNDFVGQWLCASPASFDMHHVRRVHFHHHSTPLEGMDPDLPWFRIYPVRKGSLFRMLLRDILGITNFRGHVRVDAAYIWRTVKDGRISPRFCYEALSAPAMLAAIWLGFLLTGHGIYFIFWLLAGPCVGTVLFRLGSPPQHGGLKANPDQSLCTRTIVNPWQSFWIAPYGTNYHIEHHLFPQVPSFNLHEVHRILLEAGALPKENVYRSYGDVWRSLVRSFNSPDPS